MASSSFELVSSITVRLIRADRTVDDAMRSESNFKEVAAAVGRLFVGQSPTTPPRWARFVKAAAAPESDCEFRTQSCGAVLFVTPSPDVEPNRIFALTFGTGQLALNPDAVERNFGLKVTLNSVARSKLRTLDVANLDATVIQRRTQASKDVDIDSFGIDKNRELLRLAAGTPSDQDLARTLSGKDSLTLNRRYSISTIRPLCRKLLILYEGLDYRGDYEFIDNIQAVRDRSLSAELDEQMFSEICSLVGGSSSDLHLSLPEILDPSRSLEVAYLGAKLKSGRKNVYPQVDIRDYAAELRLGNLADLTMETWRSTHEIRFAEAGEKNWEATHKIHDCIVWEVNYNSSTYVAFGGEWFAIDRKFYQEVENDFQRLRPHNLIVSSTHAKNERQLLSELDAKAELLLMDQTRTNPTDASQAKIEFCDFLSSDRKLVHLKDGHASTSISHLWSQGVVGGESFCRDEGFRRELLKNVRQRQKDSGKAGFESLLPTPAKRPTTSDFTVVYGVMRERLKRSGKLDIPFFSKVSLRAAVQRLDDLGFKVEVQLIEMV